MVECRALWRTAGIAALSAALLHASGQATRAQAPATTLTIARTADPTSLDPAVPNDNMSIWTISLLYDGLLRINDDGTGIEPDLATSWSISADGLTYVFKIRSGVKFADGSPLTVDDVVYSLDRAIHYSGFSLLNFVKSVSSTSPDSVTIELAEPSAALLAILAQRSAMILPRAKVQPDAKAFAQHPVGTGPFKLTEWTRGQRVVLERNDGYWDRAHFSGPARLHFTTVPDDNARILALQQGSIDVATEMPLSVLAPLRAAPTYVVQTNTSLRVDFLQMNETRPPFNDPNIRQALNYAIDKAGILNSLLAGNGRIANSYLPPMPGWDASLPAYPYDPEKAKALLAGSSRPRGLSVTILIAAGDATAQQIAELAQQNLAAIGIDLSIQQLDIAALVAARNRFDYDIIIRYYSSDILDPSQLTRFAVDGSSPSKSDHTGYNNPTVNDLAHQAERVTNDDAKRWALYSQIQKQVNEDAPYVFLYYSPSSTVVRSNVKGFSILPTGNYSLRNVTIGAR